LISLRISRCRSCSIHTPSLHTGPPSAQRGGRGKRKHMAQVCHAGQASATEAHLSSTCRTTARTPPPPPPPPAAAAARRREPLRRGAPAACPCSRADRRGCARARGC
jgi:hypothetical protein